MASEFEPYENLANAIIISAVRDYRAAGKRLRKHPDSRLAADEIKTIEKFFFSPWFQVLTDMDPEFLVERLRAEK